MTTNRTLTHKPHTRLSEDDTALLRRLERTLGASASEVLRRGLHALARECAEVRTWVEQDTREQEQVHDTEF
jgi:hypothetical protein